MNEAQGREAILKAAESWLQTPYKNTGSLRGVGANCATLLYGIARDAGTLAPEVGEPKWYSPQLHAHSPEERLIESIKACGCVEIREDQVKPGDVVAYLTGMSHGHLGLIIEWPRKILQTTQLHGCQYAHGKGGRLAGCKMRFFSLWTPEDRNQDGDG